MRNLARSVDILFRNVCQHPAEQGEITGLSPVEGRRKTLLHIGRHSCLAGLLSRLTVARGRRQRIPVLFADADDVGDLVFPQVEEIL